MLDTCWLWRHDNASCLQLQQYSSQFHKRQAALTLQGMAAFCQICIPKFGLMTKTSTRALNWGSQLE